MKSLLEATALVLVAGTCSVIAYFVHPKAPSFAMDAFSITLAAAQEASDALWVDARTDEDFERGHLEGAIPLNEERWEELLTGFLDVWSPDAPTIVYCSSQSCLRSHEVAERLREELGIETIFALEGGWESLVDAGMAKEGEQ